MRTIARGALTTVAAAACLAAAPALASATLAPDPYATVAGDGSFTGDSAVGSSTCLLANLVADAHGTRRGAHVAVRDFDAACAGVITAAEHDRTIRFRIRRGEVRGTISIVIANLLGGRCRYRGEVTGTLAPGSGTLSAAGTVALRRTLAAPCAPDSRATLVVNLPGAAVSW